MDFLTRNSKAVKTWIHQFRSNSISMFNVSFKFNCLSVVSLLRCSSQSSCEYVLERSKELRIDCLYILRKRHIYFLTLWNNNNNNNYLSLTWFYGNASVDEINPNYNLFSLKKNGAWIVMFIVHCIWRCCDSKIFLTCALCVWYYMLLYLYLFRSHG